ncbi:glutathione S-transferase [Neptunomonas phycophila]|uniref:Glutathione S-transferase n=1 Tax=Neptunomonas phycophila TaxID=1572645 RepID=A0AAW7XHY9_9GAMM|nr:glutathione S-transferase [Neptunomonas phycophila]MDO6454031.1 glutathione S-transferase [Neptunomonas phycophila]
MSCSLPSQPLPILYSFRRCPYAIRARIALVYSGVEVEHREVVLKDKPKAMLAISPKGTVPVLHLPDGRVLEESTDIMRWALLQHDGKGWLTEANEADVSRLIMINDSKFKPWLDRYKYADRYPEHPMEYYRSQCEEWLTQIEGYLLANDGCLLSAQYTMADMAIFPFIRQCAHVDKAWFEKSPYPNLKIWLTGLLESSLFASVMMKHPQWKG